VMSPNEARTVEGLAPVKGGDTVFLQQQMISIDMLGELHAAAIKRANAPPPAPAAPAVDDPPDDPPDAEDKTADPAITRALVVDMVDRKRKAA